MALMALNAAVGAEEEAVEVQRHQGFAPLPTGPPPLMRIDPYLQPPNPYDYHQGGRGYQMPPSYPPQPGYAPPPQPSQQPPYFNHPPPGPPPGSYYPPSPPRRDRRPPPPPPPHYGGRQQQWRR